MAHPVTQPRESGEKRPEHSGDGHLLTNVLVFGVMILLFAGAIYSLAFFERTNVWPFAVCLGLFFLAFWIPQAILGRSDTGPQLAKGDRKA